MTAALAWRAIPLTIFCAGYGNVAMEVLRRGSPKITGPGGVFTPHLRLVANFFRVRFFFLSFFILYRYLAPYFYFILPFFNIYYCLFFVLLLYFRVLSLLLYFLFFLLYFLLFVLLVVRTRYVFFCTTVCVFFMECSVCVFKAGPWFVMCWLG